MRSSWLALIACGGAWCAACSLLVDTADLVDDGGDRGRRSDAAPDVGDGAVDAAVAADAAETRCPASNHGAPLVPVAGFCMDRTEVTNTQYATFLADVGTPSSQPAFCSFKTSYVPGAWPVSNEMGERPVASVDWCDARAYCAWAGKRLCGKIGGGSAPFDQLTNPKVDEWAHACTRAGTSTFPYGAAFESGRCWTPANDLGPTAVGSQLRCEGGYPGLFDMSGNVWEWEDACDGTSGPADHCRLRGGSFKTPSERVDCFGLPNSNPQRSSRFTDVGIRCCSDAL